MDEARRETLLSLLALLDGREQIEDEQTLLAALERWRWALSAAQQRVLLEGVTQE